MPWLLALLLALMACTPAPAPVPGPVASSQNRPSPPAVATDLPAAEPQLPSLAAFRRRAAKACDSAAIAIAGAPVTADPFREDARRRDIRAAVAHYRTAAASWTAAANELWDFGLPRQRVAQRLITNLDTLAQYSQQVAEFLAAGDHAGAQAALAAVDLATQDVNVAAKRLGIGRIEECGTTPVILPSAQPVQVTAVDFDFELTSPRAGPVRFVLRNRGFEPHHLFVVRLRDAGTVDDAVRADRHEQRPEQFLRGEGHVSPVAGPGKEVMLDVRLRPGVYGLVCFVASEDGTPHAYKGMATEIIVSR